ncbi:hypothetical protein P153DRAFT_71929 [Dothidotthia symphoricarpi CBS 119687]|uniref:Uncharacterized protein n=1 Tax=Dothidotthia symphoricarpi CBS 119687 TaxID=1392245 RepID=A0A6A6A893_9PLEO|nr:uncharacterized protein P153DRAFT_71929 [Dothidotthia symphoricarpi CBS 119687]KAF2126871.1 hypothetical protein P153DRAFT_71929 [Dothidotthia symphoricarpi CBS 119687]
MSGGSGEANDSEQEPAPSKLSTSKISSTFSMRKSLRRTKSRVQRALQSKQEREETAAEKTNRMWQEWQEFVGVYLRLDVSTPFSSGVYKEANNRFVVPGMEPQYPAETTPTPSIRYGLVLQGTEHGDLYNRYWTIGDRFSGSRDSLSDGAPSVKAPSTTRAELGRQLPVVDSSPSTGVDQNSPICNPPQVPESSTAEISTASVVDESQIHENRKDSFVPPSAKPCQSMAAYAP